MVHKMSRQERAKQFMPFAALKGYEKALREKERIVVPKKELSEDSGEEIDRKLHQIQRRDIVTVICFQEGEYVKLTGMVSAIDCQARFLKIVNTKVNFDDIYDIVR